MTDEDGGASIPGPDAAQDAKGVWHRIADPIGFSAVLVCTPALGRVDLAKLGSTVLVGAWTYAFEARCTKCFPLVAVK